jgi:hypothetical protein
VDSLVETVQLNQSEQSGVCLFDEYQGLDEDASFLSAALPSESSSFTIALDYRYLDNGTVMRIWRMRSRCSVLTSVMFISRCRICNYSRFQQVAHVDIGGNLMQIKTCCHTLQISHTTETDLFLFY